MPNQTQTKVNLAKSFAAVTQALEQNQSSLNDSDDYNHNHGDNMVRNFQVITQAMQETKGSSPSEQLAHASQVLAQTSQSGSAQLYSQGLAEAATRFQGQRAVTADNAIQLIQALMGGQAGGGAAQGAGMGQGADSGAMGDLLGSLLGGGQASGEMGQPSGGGQADPMSAMLGSLLGGAGQTQAPTGQGGQAGGLNMENLLGAGMAFLQARQQGAQPMDALVQAVMAGSQMNNNTAHSQSGQVVASTLLQAVGSMLGGRRR